MSVCVYGPACVCMCYICVNLLKIYAKGLYEYGFIHFFLRVLRQGSKVD